MRLPLPGPRDVWHVLERSAEGVEQLAAAVPRLVGLIGQAEHLVGRAQQLVEHIEATTSTADAVVERVSSVADRADGLVADARPLTDRLAGLLDRLEPPLTDLQPVLDRLAETTDPHEVDALVVLVDQLPLLAEKLQTDIIPVLDSLSTVAPDLHDLLDVSRELNGMLGQIPGLGRMKRRIDAQQEEQARR